MREAEVRDRGGVRSPSVILSFPRMAGGTLSGWFLGLAACEQIRCEKCETRGTGYVLSLAVAWPVASP